MDFDKEIEQLNKESKDIQLRIDKLKKEYKECKIRTEKLLNECGKSGIKRLSISRKDDLIPSCKNWPFSYQGSVFATKVKDSDWPAIWGCIQKAGLEMGCGNSDQAQTDTDLLVDGVYEIKSGKWTKVK